MVVVSPVFSAGLAVAVVLSLAFAAAVAAVLVLPPQLVKTATEAVSANADKSVFNFIWLIGLTPRLCNIAPFPVPRC